MNKAQMYSVMLDTTQDIAAKDQCAIVIRYVGNNSVYERLISLVNCTDTTGQGMFQLLKDVLKSNDIYVKNCVANATDGAANMQGEYNGFNAWLNETAPNQVHVWCYSHVLNLVMSDASKSPLPAATLFTILNSLAIFFLKNPINAWNILLKDVQAIVVCNQFAKLVVGEKKLLLIEYLESLMIHLKACTYK